MEWEGYISSLTVGDQGCLNAIATVTIGLQKVGDEIGDLTYRQTVSRDYDIMVTWMIQASMI